jgi:hypothetical protein
METKSNFSLTKKCFLLINFSNGKQTHESLKSDFLNTTFHEINGPKNLFMKNKCQVILLIILYLFHNK